MDNDEREALAREIVAIARKYNITSVTLQYRDGFPRHGEEHGLFHGQHTIAWSQGRHGATSNISISYSDTRGITEAAPPEPALCEHDWQYSGADYHGSHKGEDAYRCSKCHEKEYRP